MSIKVQSLITPQSVIIDKPVTSGKISVVGLIGKITIAINHSKIAKGKELTVTMTASETNKVVSKFTIPASEPATFTQTMLPDGNNGIYYTIKIESNNNEAVNISAELISESKYGN